MSVYSQSIFPPQKNTSYDVDEITNELVKLQSLSNANEILESFQALPSNYYMFGKEPTETPLHRMIYIKKPYSLRVHSKNPLSIGGNIETTTLFYNSANQPILRIGINIVCRERKDRDKLAKAFLKLLDSMDYTFSDYDKQNRCWLGKTKDMLHGVVVKTPNGFDGHWELYVSIGAYDPYMAQE